MYVGLGGYIALSGWIVCVRGFCPSNFVVAVCRTTMYVNQRIGGGAAARER
jgi:hypothetical protein